MNWGDLYRVRRPGSGDPKKFRVFAIVSRQTLVDSRFSTVVCAPVYTRRDGLSTEIDVGAAEGLKHDSSIRCDALVSLLKASLIDYLGRLPSAKLDLLDQGLRIALAVDRSRLSFLCAVSSSAGDQLDQRSVAGSSG